jgi:hypothetical protein
MNPADLPFIFAAGIAFVILGVIATVWLHWLVRKPVSRPAPKPIAPVRVISVRAAAESPEEAQR